MQNQGKSTTSKNDIYFFRTVEITNTPPKSSKINGSNASTSGSQLNNSHTYKIKENGQLKRGLKVFSDLVDDQQCRLKLQQQQIVPLIKFHRGLQLIESQYNYQAKQQTKQQAQLVQQAFCSIKKIGFSLKNQLSQKLLTPQKQSLTYHRISQSQQTLTTNSKLGLTPSNNNNQQSNIKVSSRQETAMRYNILLLAIRLNAIYLKNKSFVNKQDFESPQNSLLSSENIEKAIQIYNQFKKVSNILLKQKLAKGFDYLRECNQMDREPEHRRNHTQPQYILEQFGDLLNKINYPGPKKYTEKIIIKHTRKYSDPNFVFIGGKNEKKIATQPVIQSAYLREVYSFREYSSPNKHPSSITSDSQLKSLQHMLPLVTRRIGNKMIYQIMFESFQVLKRNKLIEMNNVCVQRNHQPFWVHQLFEYNNYLDLSPLDTEEFSSSKQQIVQIIDDQPIFDHINESIIAIENIETQRINMEDTQLLIQIITNFESNKLKDAFIRLKSFALFETYKHLQRPFKQLTFSLGHVFKYKLMISFSLIKDSAMKSKYQKLKIKPDPIAQLKNIYKLVSLLNQLIQRNVSNTFSSIKNHQKKINDQIIIQGRQNIWKKDHLSLIAHKKSLPRNNSLDLTFIQVPLNTKSQTEQVRVNTGQILKFVQLAQKIAKINSLMIYTVDNGIQKMKNVRTFEIFRCLSSVEQEDPYKVRIYSPNNKEVFQDNYDTIKEVTDNQVQGANIMHAYFLKKIKQYLMNLVQFAEQRQPYNDSPFSNIKINKSKYFTSLALPQIQEVVPRKQQNSTTKHRSQSAQAFLNFGNSNEGDIESLVNGEEVIIERDICFNFNKKMMIQNNMTQYWKTSRSNSIQVTPAASPRENRLLNRERSFTDKKRFQRGSAVSQLVIQKAKQGSPKVIMIVKNDPNIRQSKPGHLYKMVHDPEGYGLGSSGTSSDQDQSSSSPIQTQKIVAHIAFQKRNHSILEIPRTKKKVTYRLHVNEILGNKKKIQLTHVLIFLLITCCITGCGLILQLL